MKIFVFNSSAFMLFYLQKYQTNTHQRRRKKRRKKKGGSREKERENMSQSNSNGLQIFWLVKSYSLIVITVQHFFPPKTCSLQGIVCQTFIEKTVTGQQLHMLRCNWLRKYNTCCKDFNHHCKDFRAKEWHAFEFYNAGALS